MSASAGWQPDPQDAALLRWWDGAQWTAHTAPRAVPPPPVEGQHQGTERDSLEAELTRLRSQIVETRDLMLLQEVGIYRYAHPLEDAAEYEDALAEIESQLKAFIKEGRAASGTKRWAINGSDKEGAKMIADITKLMLRAYNSEAESVLRALRPFKIDISRERLNKMRESISSLGKSMQIQISEDFHRLRIRELELTADYLQKKEEEKEAEREERTRLKEEEAARKELEREQLRLEKERQHYLTALKSLESKGDVAASAEVKAKVAEVENALRGVEARAANVRAGYVYIISNWGSFGERVIKIGLTRRLDPMERVRELGDASVPFRFDVHAIIFSDDAVGLETKLHQRFASRRVNLVNTHREYFFAQPVEVKETLMELQGHLLSFHDGADAVEWRQSEATRRSVAI